jgi:hypothetical protein
MMGMPSPQDAPATTDALTAGGGSDNDDDDEDNDDDSGGSRDNDNDNDQNKDNNNDNEPIIPKDAPATTSALTAKKIECLPGQEVRLFSTSCEPKPTTTTAPAALGGSLVVQMDPNECLSPPETTGPSFGDDVAVVDQDNCADQDAANLGIQDETNKQSNNQTI